MSLFPIIAPVGIGPFSLSFIVGTQVGNNVTDYSGLFDGIAIGTAASYAARRVVIGVSNFGNGGRRATSSVTVGGVSLATDLEFLSTSYNLSASIWSGLVPSGDTADIDIVSGGASESMGIGVWTLDNANATKTDTLTNESDPPSGAITIPANGGMIAIAMNDHSSSGYSWTNATERFDTVIEASRKHTGADSTTAGTPTITADPDDTNLGMVVAVAWENG